MNKVVGGLIIFVGGLAAGGFGGYIIGRKKEMARADKEIESMKAYYESKCKADTSAKAKAIISESLGKGGESEDSAKDEFERKGPDSVPVSDPKADKANMAVDYGKYSDIVEVYDSKDGIKAAVNVPEQTKYLITEEEYEADEDFEKEQLYYYLSDNILCDEHDMQVSFDVIGREHIDRFFTDHPDPYLYVRNTDEETDYEVALCEGFYDPGTLRGGRDDD